MLDLAALRVEHAHGAERDLHRLAEAQHDLAGRALGDRAALGRGALEQRVGVRGPGRGEHGARARAGAVRSARLTRPPPAPGRRRRAAAAQHEHARCRARSARSAEIQISAASAAQPPGSGTQSSVPAIGPGAPPTVIGTFQSKMCAVASSSVTCGGVRLAHPVHPVVVPLEAPAAADELPARLRCRAPSGHRDVAVAVVVEVEGLGVRVDLDGAVAEHAGVRLARGSPRSRRARRSCCAARAGRRS